MPRGPQSANYLLQELSKGAVIVAEISINQSQYILSAMFFSPGTIYYISLPQSVPSPELLDSPSPSSEVTKKSNSFKASSVSLSSLLSDSTLFLTI